MSTVRLRRLTADFAKLSDYVRRHPRVRLIQTDGDPPERYQLEYRIDSVRMVNNELKPTKNHIVEIFLPRNYPRTPPQCRMLSPVFHPNIAPHAICVGDHWSSGESLQSIAVRIGELLAYQSYNVKSPLNGEAARWVEQNEEKMPLDSVSLLIEDEKFQPGIDTPSNQRVVSVASSTAPETTPKLPAGSSATNSSAEKAAEIPSKITCPHCQKVYHLREGLVGRKVKCANCKQVFTIPAELPEADA